MKVYFNASVILSGIYSSAGASWAMLELVKNGDIEGIISELVFDEVVRHADKVGLTQIDLEEKVLSIFNNPISQPAIALIEKYASVVIDEGDAHVLASCEEAGCQIVVSLDKKHILSLEGKVERIRIMSPGDFVMWYRKTKSLR